jgi:hypothetical protein
MGQTADELRSQINDQRDDVGRDLEAIGDRLSPRRMVDRRRARVRQAWHDTRDRVMGTAESMQSSAGDTAGGAVESLQSAATSAKDTATRLPEMARQQAQGSPLVAVGVAFGAGFLLASVLPTSRQEDQLAQRFGSELGTGADRLKEGVKQTVRDVADQMSDEVQDAGRNVAETARGAMDEVKANATNANATNATGEVSQF